MSVMTLIHILPTVNAIIRNFTFDDVLSLTRIYNAYTAAIGQRSTATVDQFENICRNFGHGDALKDIFIIEAHHQPIGYYSVEWKDTVDQERIYTWSLRLMPEYLDGSIERELLPFITERAYELSQEHPTQHREWLQMSTLINPVTKTAQIVETDGYQAIRYSYTMTRDLTQPITLIALPEGLEVRPASSDDTRKVWEADVNAFRDHWGFREPSETDYQAWINDPVVFQPELWKIAWDGDRIAGMIWNFVDHAYNREFNAKRGYTESISTQRDWRRKGVAAALLSQSLQMHKDMGMTQAALSVDAQNPTGALGVYQRAGFVVEYQYTIYRKAVV